VGYLTTTRDSSNSDLLSATSIGSNCRIQDFNSNLWKNCFVGAFPPIICAVHRTIRYFS